jgi:hypothetical protein
MEGAMAMDGKRLQKIEAGRLLRAARARLYSDGGSPLTQRDMANLSGYSHQRVSNWEGGHLPVNRQTLLLLIEHYRLTWEEAVQFLILLHNEGPTLKEWEQYGNPVESLDTLGLQIGNLRLPGISESVLRNYLNTLKGA